MSGAKNYVAMLSSDSDPGRRWLDELAEALALQALDLIPAKGSRPMVIAHRDAGDLIEAEFVALTELAERYPGAAWVDRRPSCPFLTDHRCFGALVWSELHNDEADLRREWLHPLAKEGAFTIFPEDAPELSRDLVALLRYPASDLMSPWGLDDGDCCLSREFDQLHDYRKETARDLSSQLQRAGFDLEIHGPELAMHNPFQLAHPPAGPARRELFRRLAPLDVQFWGYDLKAAADFMFDRAS